MKKSRWSVVALVTVVLATLAATTTASAARVPYASTAASAASCTAPQIGLIAPITGPAASIGKEIRDWTRYSVSSIGKSLGLKAKLVETDNQLDPAQASKRATQLNSNSAVLGVVGPADSQSVLASAPIFKKTKMPYLSGSATRTTLTDGSIPTFSRVIPNDGVQGPTTARFIRTKLNAKKVVIIDDQTAYSVPLANSVQSNLKANNIAVDRQSVNQTQTDFSALVATVGDDVDVLYLPWQIAANGQLFAQQMKEQGKKATIIGSDGLFSGDFTSEGAYVFSFAPDIRGIPADKAIIKGFTKAYPNTNWGTFGPPAYLSAQVLLMAIDKACADGKVSRAEVAREVRKVRIPNSILGEPARLRPEGRSASGEVLRFPDQEGQACPCRLAGSPRSAVDVRPARTVGRTSVARAPTRLPNGACARAPTRFPWIA